MRFLSSEGWKEKSKLAKRLDAGEARHDERRLHATVFTQGELLGEQGVDGFERGYLAVFETAHNGVKDLDGARHFEADQ